MGLTTQPFLLTTLLNDEFCIDNDVMSRGKKRDFRMMEVRGSTRGVHGSTRGVHGSTKRVRMEYEGSTRKYGSLAFFPLCSIVFLINPIGEMDNMFMKVTARRSRLEVRGE